MNVKCLLLGSLLLGSVIARAAEPPIMEWLFNTPPVLGTEMTDATGKARGELWAGQANDGKVPALLSAGVPCGTAWNFGDSDTILAVTQDAGVQSLGNPALSKGMAFAFWVKKDNTDRAATNLRVFGLWSVVDCSAGYNSLTFSTKGLPKGVEPAPATDTDPMYLCATAEGVLNGAWHHVVFSADFTTPESNVVLYVDGVEVARASVDYSKATSTQPGRRFYIGGRLNGGGRWTGELGRFVAWNRALTAAEVAKMNPVKK